MYWLVENEEQLNVLINSGYKKAFIEVIPYNDTIHPVLNHVSLVYIRPIEASKGFMVCVTHSESLNALNTRVNELIDKFEVLYCRDKKETLHYFPNKTLYDITPPPHTYIRPTTQTHDLYYSKHKDNPHLNLIIPIVKHYELCETIFGDLKANETFSEYFHPVDGEYVYTQFNLKTTTTRPSNKFKNVNYAALNKENGCRKSFIPRNNRFVEIDISAYHPSLAARLVDYTFPTSDIHSHFASLYKVDYKKSKELTFKQLYGGVFENYRGLEFFKRIEKYVGDNWKQFQNNGYLECPISNFVYTKENLGEMNPQKLFNYLLQNMETSQNVLVLWDICCILRGCKTKLVLYTYDSFTFDVDDNEIEVLNKIRETFNKYKLSIKEETGYDYNFKG